MRTFSNITKGSKVTLISCLTTCFFVYHFGRVKLFYQLTFLTQIVQKIASSTERPANLFKTFEMFRGVAPNLFTVNTANL